MPEVEAATLARVDVEQLNKSIKARLRNGTVATFILVTQESRMLKRYIFFSFHNIEEIGFS